MPTINPSDDPALSGPANNGDGGINNGSSSSNDPATNNYQNLFHDSSERGGEDNINPMQLDVAGHEEEDVVSSTGRNDWNGGDGVTNGYDGSEEAVPPLPPPLDDVDSSSAGGGGEVVLIPNTVDHHHRNNNNNLEGEEQPQQQQQREEAIVVEGEIIGPMPQQQQRQEEAGVQLQAGVPVETVQLWEEVAFGLEKNQTGKFLSCVFLMYFI